MLGRDPSSIGTRRERLIKKMGICRCALMPDKQERRGRGIREFLGSIGSSFDGFSLWSLLLTVLFLQLANSRFLRTAANR
jgi:hypothetical protein